MRTEDLLDVIGEVDDELLERSEKKIYKSKNVWKKWISLAACACLVLVAGVWVSQGFQMKSESAHKEDFVVPECEVEADDSAIMEGTSTEEEVPAEPDYGINPLQGASPIKSALAFYEYEGEKVTCYYMYDRDMECNILDLIASIDYEVVDRSQVEITYPIYGIEIGRDDGWTARVAWSNGYWFTADGSFLKADFDMGSLKTDYEWEDSFIFDSMGALPCAKYICQLEDGWRADLMTEADKLQGQKNVTMTITKQTETALNVTIENNSVKEWEYGQNFAVQVLLDGVWYDVPTTPDTNWVFTSELMILPKGEKVDRSYGLHMYGELPMGTYRLVVEGITAEFEIE